MDWWKIIASFAAILFFSVAASAIAVIIIYKMANTRRVCNNCVFMMSNIKDTKFWCNHIGGTDKIADKDVHTCKQFRLLRRKRDL